MKINHYIFLSVLLFMQGFTVFGQAVPELIYYKFDTPGTTVQNLASAPAGTNPAVIDGLTIGSAGQFGTALIGNGGSSTSNSVNTGWAPNLGSGSWTISMWLNNIPSSTGTQYFFGDVNSNSFRAFSGGVAGAGGIRLVGGGIVAIDMPNVVSNGPVVIHYVHDAAAGNIKGYVNGVLTVTSNQSAVNFTGTGPFKVGGTSSSTSMLAGGLLDEFRLYNRALTGAEVASTWNQTLPYTPAPNDAGVFSISAPATPISPGNHNIVATVKNFGTNLLTGAQINWKVGSVTGTPFSWTGSLATNAVGTPVTIGAFNFPNGTHIIKAWTTAPNGSGDGNNFNDTTTITVIACNTISGTFTINQNLPSSATNYVSFGTAFQALNTCGLSGPVIFNVTPGTGPYTEQIEIGEISGASAVNTITINGNNNKITFAPSANRAVIRLDGTDYLTIDSLQIETTSTDFGWGIHLQNEANNNTITNSTITIGATSTTESNSAGIVFANSTTVVTTAGNTGNNNLISNNTISGGYKGIHLNSVLTTASNNQIRNNNIKDFYADGIKINAATGTVVEGNTISRPNRSAVTTFTGIEVTGNSNQSLISKNRIHTSHGGAAAKTGTVYGVYFTAADAAAGSENIAANNLIYNIDNTGTVYGIYNSSSDGAFYYHNTINLNNSANTGTNRGFYQTSAATNIKFINNIVTLNAGPTGAKHALYFGTAASAITSNNNVLRVIGAGASSGIGYSGASHTTLADWQAATSHDAGSSTSNPQYANTNTGNYMPTNAAINNIGQGVGITTDINGTTRSLTTPDPGAYEFMNNAADIQVLNITAPNSICGLTAAEMVTISLKNNGTVAQNSIPVRLRVNGGNPVNETVTVSPNGILPGTVTSYTFTAPVNLSAAGVYMIEVCALLPGDMVTGNDCFTKTVTNATTAGLPDIDFETPATGLNALYQVTNTRSSVSESTNASFGTGSAKGLVMEGIDHASWVLPSGSINPWTVNPEHFSGVYLCFNPAGGNPSDPLWLTLDLKQLFKFANVNTNFRVTINGAQVGPTYNPPFSGTPIVWEKVAVEFTAYKNNPIIQIGLESSVREGYQNGTGTANLIDNVQVVRFDPTVGIKDALLQVQMVVYPNPSTGIFNLILPEGNTFTIEVSDLTGNVVKAQNGKAGENQLKLEGAAKGIYLLRVSSEEGLAVKKLIIE